MPIVDSHIPDVTQHPDKVLVPSLLNCAMPDQDVSDRTLATRQIGADIMLRSLMSGEWHFLDDYDKAIIGEFIGRVVANAERQGVVPRAIEPETE